MKILIVGAGIAGICQHYYFLQQGIKAQLLHTVLPGSSSIAAAGIINPLTGPDFSKSWRFDELMRAFLPFYTGLGKLLGLDVIQPVKFYRYLNPDQVNTWLTKKVLPAYAPYCGELLEKVRFADGREKQKVLVNNAFRLDLEVLIPAYLNYLDSEQLLIRAIFDYKALEWVAGGIHYRGAYFDKVIFAEGYRIFSNPYFNYIPVLPNFGQALLVSDQELEGNVIEKAKHLYCRWSSGKCWYGATMHRMKDVNDLQDQTAQLVADYRVDRGKDAGKTEPLNGIRPTMPDRRPVAGMHPLYPALFCLNGLGTKGASLAPWVATLLGAFILSGQPIPDELNTNRYANKWSM